MDHRVSARSTVGRLHTARRFESTTRGQPYCCTIFARQAKPERETVDASPQDRDPDHPPLPRNQGCVAPSGRARAAQSVEHARCDDPRLQDASSPRICRHSRHAFHGALRR
ncbi:MAG: hypothetical protein MZU84_02655 [Sphingobacterium sp.]|nr:hypothetical protein [Sphingobacterium sp.]